MKRNNKRKFAVFGGGCFWCTEAVFRMLNGVITVVPGYAGGEKSHPTYREVSSEMTGHAEVVRIEYDPEIISFHLLLTVFFATHDPTSVNRQGSDIGSQYRSIILYTTQEQKNEAEIFIREIESSSSEGNHVVTEVKSLADFYEAENYHHNYFAKNPGEGYCQRVVNPKVEKVQKKFVTLLKPI